MSKLTEKEQSCTGAPMSYCQSCADLQSELTQARAQRDELAAALAATLPALIRLGDFVGNVDEGGPSNQGRIDRCTLILAVRAALAHTAGPWHTETGDAFPGQPANILNAEGFVVAHRLGRNDAARK